MNFRFCFNYMPHGLSFRQSPLDQFRIQIPPIKRPVKDWKTECLYVARDIQKSAGKKPLLLFLSGGIDSQAVALCFKELKIPFQPIIIKFVNDLNIHDIQSAFYFCDQNNLEPKIIEIDPFQKLKDEGLFFSEQSQCVSPQLVIFLILSASFEGFFVFGWGDPYFVWNEKHEEWLWEEEEKFYSPSKFFEQKNQPCCTHYFSATPEIILSQLEDPITQSFLNSHGDYFDFLKYKGELYNKHFNLGSRESYTGFEKMEKADKHYRQIFSSKPLNRNQIIHIPVKLLIKRLNQGLECLPPPF